eukprot:g12426.t2
MCLVESIDHMKGFAVVTRFIVRCTREKPGRLMPIVCVLAFFLSSVIDNLTATIVCIKILQRVVPHNQERCALFDQVISNKSQDWRHSCGGLVVVAANAGGAWSPIGDVTTTMLWVQQKISTAGIVAKRCAPKHEGEAPPINPPVASRNSKIVLSVGILCILMVPVVKMVTGLPPYLGMMMALGVFWLVSEIGDLANVDLSSLLFFTGVLMGVSALESAEVLANYSEFMRRVTKGSDMLLAVLIGVSSAVVDNVPLVQASIEMFDDNMDSPLWQLLSAGTGGSMLAVGSVAGVTLMGLEKVGFLWYMKRISPWAALGFILGLVTYQLQRMIASGTLS